MLWTLVFLIVPPLGLKASVGSGKENKYLQLERIYFNFRTTQIEKQSNTIIVFIFKVLVLLLFFLICLFLCLFDLTWYLMHLYKWKTVIVCAGGDLFKDIKKIYILSVIRCLKWLWSMAYETHFYTRAVVELSETCSIHCSFSSFYRFTRRTSALLFNTFIFPQKIVHVNLGSIKMKPYGVKLLFK